MRLLMPIILSSILLSSIAFAGWQDNLFSIVEPPPMPTTGNQLCQPYAIRNVRCSGDIKIYEQCIETMSGSKWETRTENCKLHGGDWYCINNECVQSSTSPPQQQLQNSSLIIVILLIIIGVVLWKRR